MARASTVPFGHFTLMLETEPGVFAAPCGITKRSITFTKATSDTVTPDCDNDDAPAWIERDVLSFSAAIAGNGVLAREAFPIWRATFEAGLPTNVRIYLTGGPIGTDGYWEGAFFLTSFELGATRGQRLLVTIEMLSSGSVVWTSTLPAGYMYGFAIGNSSVAGVGDSTDLNADVFVFMGQSNSLGFGTTGSDVPVDNQAVIPTMFYWRDDQSTGGVDYGWFAYQAGVTSNPTSTTPTPQNWGAEARFGKLYAAAHPGRNFYVFKGAVAGSQLANSTTYGKAPGVPDRDWSPTSTGELFDDTRDDFQEAMADLVTLGLFPRVRFVHWMQGESDADDNPTPTIADLYQTHLEELIAAVRAEFGSGADTAPWIIGRITFTKWERADRVRHGQARVAAQTALSIRMLDTDAYGLHSDGLHYNGAGQDTFGSDTYAAYTASTWGAPITSFPSTYAMSAQAGTPLYQPIGTVAAVGGTPAATYSISGSTAGVGCDFETGIIYSSDPAALTAGTRTITVTASNGYPGGNKTSTLTLTIAAVTATTVNRLAVIDPHNPSYYSLVASEYDSITDTGIPAGTSVTGKGFSRFSVGTRPVFANFPTGNRKGIHFVGASDLLVMSAATAGYVGGVDKDACFYGLIHIPSGTGLTGAHSLLAVSGGTTSQYVLNYNYTTGYLFTSAAYASNGAAESLRMSTTPVALDTTYKVLLRRSFHPKTGWHTEAFIDGVKQTLQRFVSSAWADWDHKLTRPTMHPTGTQGWVLGTQATTAGQSDFWLGKSYFIKGDPTASEIAFMTAQLDAWATADVTAPTISTGASLTLLENLTAVTTLAANEDVTWSLVGGADQVKFTVNTTSGALAFATAPNFELPTDADLNNTYVVQVRATDLVGLTTDKTITVTVTNDATEDLTPPTITSSSSKSVAENAVLVHALTANESVTWTVIGGADQAKFEIVGSTLRFLGNAVKDYEYPDDANGDNTYVVQVRATDLNNNTTDQTINVAVTNVSDTVTDIAGRAAVLDPHNATYYTLVSGEYDTALDTGSPAGTNVLSRTVTATQTGRRPLQITFPGTSKNAFNFAHDAGTAEVMALTSWSSFLTEDVSTDFTIFAVIYIPAGLAKTDVGPAIAGVQASTTTIANAIAVDYSPGSDTFKLRAAAISNLGAGTNGTTTNSFSCGTPYFVRLRRQGATLQLYVNEVLQTLTGLGTVRDHVVISGNVGGLIIGSTGNLGNTSTQSYKGYLGKIWFIAADPSQSEINFLYADLQAWAAGSGGAIASGVAAATGIASADAVGTTVGGVTAGTAAANGAATVSGSGAIGGVTIYYVATGGSDSADGLTTGTPWQTVTKVNAATLVSGDQVLFNGGQTFTTTTGIVASASGVTYGSYGTGVATISSGTAAGFTATNRSDITLQDLNFAGNGTTNATNGVYILNNQAGNTKLAGILLDTLDVTGYGLNGILLYGDNGTSGFDNYIIRNCVAHANAFGTRPASGGTAGIKVNSQTGYYSGASAPAHTDGLIEDCTANNNTGKTAQSGHTGSGILVGENRDTLIDGCTAFANGANSTSSNGGPVGIWCYDSLRVTIRDCTSQGNLSSSGPDGGGFDLDGGSVDCVIEYCLSYNNRGHGYLLYSYDDSPLPAANGCSIRFNISVNDCSGIAGAGIYAHHDITGAINNRIYNNTIYQNRASKDCIALEANTGTWNLLVANNIMQTANTTAGAFRTVTAAMSNLTLLGNCYYGTSTALIAWGATNYATVSAFTTAVTTQERVGGTGPVVAISTNPLLAAPGSTTDTDYQLQSGSPCAGGGQNLNTTHSVAVPASDYFGNAFPGPDGLWSVGAHDLAAVAMVLATQTHFAQGMTPATEIARLGTAGLTHVRDEQYWSSVEPTTAGVYAFPSGFTTYMAALETAGIDALITLDFGNDLYDNGESLDPYNAPFTTGGRNAYAAYCVEVLDQYAGQITTVEIWNEYNGGSFAKGTTIAADRPLYYYQMLQTAYTAIKAAHPSVTVIGGGTVLIPLPYFQDMFDHGALNYMDGVSIHPYRQRPEGVEDEIGELRDLIDSYPEGIGKPIYVTEFGYSDVVDVDLAPDYFVKMTVLMKVAGVVYASWYLLRDFGSFTGRGFFNSSGTAYPVLDALLTMTPLMEESAVLSTRVGHETVVTFGNGTVVAWGSGQPLTIGGTLTAAKNSLGDTIATPTSLTDEPVILEGTGLSLTVGTDPLKASFYLDWRKTGWTYHGRTSGGTINTATLAEDAYSEYYVRSGVTGLYIKHGVMHPGGAEAAMARYTAAAAGAVTIAGTFEVPDSSSVGIVATIRHNGSSIWTDTVLPADGVVTVTPVNLTLAIGDTLDVTVGNNGSINFSATLVEVTVTTVATAARQFMQASGFNLSNGRIFIVPAGTYLNG